MTIKSETESKVSTSLYCNEEHAIYVPHMKNKRNKLLGNNGSSFKVMFLLYTYVENFAEWFALKACRMMRFACGAFIGGFVIAVTLATFYQPYDKLRILKLKLSMETLENSQQSKESEQSYIVNLSNWRTDAYELTGDLRLDTISSTIVVITSAAPKQNNPSPFTTRPYARKADVIAMRGVTEFKINYTYTEQAPQCQQNMTNIPAVIFSTGGYAGNYFHAFTDVLLPLFTASRRFNGSTVFLISDNNPEWTSKYRVVLNKLSEYDAYDLDRENRVLCFSSIILGLRARREFTIDEQTTKLSNRDFTNFLRNAYSLDRQSASPTRRPRMLIITRRKVRQLVNKYAVSDMARRLGFEVVLKRMVWNVSSVAKLVNTFDVLVGVHGAGLTNMVFLPEKTIVVQIVPFGLEFLSKNCFQKPAEEMNLRYLEYRAGIKEGLLSGKFSLDSKLYGDPEAVNEKGFDAFRSVYLDNQDIKIDVWRFRSTLLKALEIFKALD